MHSSGRFSPSGRSNSFQGGGNNRQSHFHGGGGGVVGMSNSNPFLAPSANTNTKFVPTKITASKIQSASLSEFATPLKAPKPPEKPLTPYMRYSRKTWDKVRAANPESKLWDIGKLVGQMWRELPDQGKQVYFDEYEIEKVEYDKAFKSYKSSAAYIAFEQQSKNKKERTDKNARPTAAVDSGIYIQPVDEDDGEEQAAMMHLVAARFERNQKLMLEIFNTSVVPDPCTVISVQRMSVLKRQVKSLTTHQRKLEDELEQLETKFQEKKRSVSDCSQNFGQKLKKVCEEMPVLNDTKFDEMVDKAATKLLQTYEEYKQKQGETIVAESVEEAPKSNHVPEIKSEILDVPVEAAKNGETETVDEKPVVQNGGNELSAENLDQAEQMETSATQPISEETAVTTVEEKVKSPALQTTDDDDTRDSKPNFEENKHIGENIEAAEVANESEIDDEGFTDDD